MERRSKIITVFQNLTGFGYSPPSARFLSKTRVTQKTVSVLERRKRKLAKKVNLVRRKCALILIS